MFDGLVRRRHDVGGERRGVRFKGKRGFEAEEAFGRRERERKRSRKECAGSETQHHILDRVKMAVESRVDGGGR